MNPNARYSGQPEPGLRLNLQIIPLHARGEWKMKSDFYQTCFFSFSRGGEWMASYELTLQAIFFARIFNN